MSSLLVLLFVLSIGTATIVTSQKNSIIGDTINSEKWITIASTVVSSGGNFEMGFFTPGNNNSNYYIGIWYKKLRIQTAIWVANRETPVSIYEMDFAQFKIADGNLVLLNGTRHTIWSTGINSTTSNSSSLVATLLDNGNLVLSDGNSNSTSTHLWTSFDHPSHTFMPGSKFGYNKRTKLKQVLTSWKNPSDPSPGPFTHEVGISNYSGQGVNMWNHSVIYWNSGPWTGNNFTGVPYQPNPMFNYTYVNNDDEVYYMYNFLNPALVSRFIMDVNGQTKQLLWMDSTNDWKVFYTDPKQVCQVFAYCGPFGTCNQNSDSECDCLPGFKPKWDRDWNLKSFSGGCMRKTSLKCGNNSNIADGEKDKFWMHPHMRLPEHNQSVIVQNEAECEVSCLQNCACVAYTYNEKRCLIWTGELLNLQQLSQDDANGSTIYVRLAASEFPNTKDTHQKQKSRRLQVVLPIGVIATLLFLLSFTYICYRKRRSRKSKENTKSLMPNTEGDQAKELIDIQDDDIDVQFYSFESILAATDDFSEQNKLGQGGFGPVYKGIFSGGREIAVKRLSSLSGQGINEFKNEVVLIARLQHRNLVRLLGYCIQSTEKILLYEYMANKSLDTFIFDQRLCTILDWRKRFQIIEGIARGLLYLHHDSRLRIIHRDLKTSNILLDEELNPKISDFGLARVVEGKVTEANTTKVVGTYGYMAPEYAIDGLFSIKSDVFSFGIVILEIISGRRNTGFYHIEEASNLLGHAWRLWQEDRAMDLVDRSLHESCDKEEAIKCLNVGLLCVQEDPKDRPNTSNVIMMLGSESISLPRPHQPAFMSRKCANNTSSSANTKSDVASNNELTVTIETGR